MSIYRGSTLIAGPGSPARNVGEIVPSLLPITDASLHLLDGALISGSGTYAAFVTYMAGLVSSYPNLFTTEAKWQSSVSAYGVCGKFVYNATNKTIRLPKVTGIIEGTVDVNALGNLVAAGLPNITGTAAGIRANKSQSGVSNGAFTWGTITGASGGNNTSENPYSSGSTLTFNASNSNSIYGKSTTVQPQTIKGYYYMVIANSTKASIVADIDKVASDLNLKAGKDELYYQPGEIFEANYAYFCPGVLTGSKTSLTWTIMLPKLLDKITGYSVTACELDIRLPTGGYMISSKWDALANADSVVVVFAKNNAIRMNVTSSTLFQSYTNNIALDVSCQSVKIKFS